MNNFEELTLLGAAKDACIMLHEVNVQLIKAGLEINPIVESPRYQRIMRAIGTYELENAVYSHPYALCGQEEN